MSIYTEKLFSYGTLQYEAVQLDTFGRKLSGKTDSILGYRLGTVQITDLKVIELSGESVHRTLKYTGTHADKVTGIVFNVSHDELLKADQYEVADYKRVKAPLASGGQTWVYVSAAN